MKRKLLMILMASMIVFSNVQFGISRVEADGSENREVKLLNALGIMNVDASTGLFWDETPVRRGEMAQILCELFGYTATVDDTPRFLDVGEKERAYVETVVRHGHMSGYDNNKFGADDYITNEQVIKIFVTIIGGKTLAENMGGYPNGYMNAGMNIGIVKGETAMGGKVARRIDVASVIYETMSADMIFLSGSNGSTAIYKSTEGETFLTENLNIYKESGIVSKNEGTSLNRANGLGEGLVQIGDEICTDSKHLADDYLGCSVTVYLKKDSPHDGGDIIYIEEDKDNESILIEDKDIVGADDNSLTYFINGKSKKVEISDIADMIYNGKAVICDLNRTDIKNGFVKLVDNNGDKLYDVVIVTEYETFVVERVNKEEEKLQLKFSEPAITLENQLYRVFRDGEAAKLEDIESGDVILVATSENTEGKKVIRIEASSLNVMGSVSQIRDDGEKTYVTIGKEEYVINDYQKSLVAKNQMSEITAGSSGQFYLDKKGAIVYCNKGSAGDSVGYLINSYIDNEAAIPTLTVKVYTEDKNIQTYKATDKISVDGARVNISDISSLTNILGMLKTPQLIKYNEKDCIIKEIFFAADGYDAQEFSCDVSGTLICTCTAILDDKYYIPSSAKVFYVPDVSEGDADYNSIINNTSYYNVYTSSYFVASDSYSVSLFDIDANGNVNYVVIKGAADNTNIKEGTSMLVVTAINKGIGDDDTPIYILKGMNERGEETELKASDAERITDSKLLRIPKKGDVIQYTTNSAGYIHGIGITHSVDESKYYDPVSIYLTSRTKKVYGEVMINSGSNILICSEPVWSNMSPLDAVKNVSNANVAIYRYDKERNRVYKSDFSEIEIGDKVFACVAGNNVTRMMVVYK